MYLRLSPFPDLQTLYAKRVPEEFGDSMQNEVEPFIYTCYLLFLEHLLNILSQNRPTRSVNRKPLSFHR